MAATELDETNTAYARENVERNGLGERIAIVPVSRAEDPLIPLDRLPVDFHE